MFTNRYAITCQGMGCVLLLGLLASLNSGCATVVNGTTQPVSLSSNPSGAEIYVDGQPMGVTPRVVTLSRGSDHYIELRKEGYLPHSVPLARQRSTATLGNIWIGGLFGMGVDALSGANYKFVPEYYNANLSPEAPVAVAARRTTLEEGATSPGVPAPGPHDNRYASGITATAPAAAYTN